MGRPKKSAPAPVEPEEESQEMPDEEPAAVIETEAAEDAEGDGPSKSEAARQAIKAGYEKPGPAVAWIKETFGIDMNPQHFSSIKSNYLKKQGGAAPAPEPAKPGRKPKTEAPAIEGYVAPPEKPKAPGEPDVLLALESVKDLVSQFGAEKLKRMVDLLG